MIYEFAKNVALLKEKGFNQFIILLIIVFSLLIIAVLVSNLIDGIVKIITSIFEFNKYNKFYKLANRQMLWYRSRARELVNKREYDVAMDYMNSGMHELCEVMKNVFPESESISGKSGQDIDRPSNDQRQSHGKITD